LPALFGALWLLGLFAAAPVLRREENYAFVDRLRDALILGVAIPFVLGFCSLLYPVALWVALAICVIVALRRGPSTAALRASAQDDRLILVAVIAMIAWPALMRPVLDGDSLSYHLPNAAAWVHAHGLWSTDPRYWWYPPASELFAAGLYAVSGPFALPWCGVGAVVLVAFRMDAWARELGASPRNASLLAAATITMLPLMLQTATLQNDVWLAAFLMESLWAASHNEWTVAARSSAVTALLKPYGFLFAFLAAAVTKANVRVWLAAAGAFALWAIHDIILWHSTVIPPGSTSYGNRFESTIIAHGLPAIGLLGWVALRTSPFVALALLVAPAGPLIATRDRAIGWAAAATFVFYLVEPLAYYGPGPQLANGASLRYAVPAMVLGALLLAPWLERMPMIATVLLTLSTVFGVAQNVYIFSSDAPTLAAAAVALLTAGAVVLSRRIGSPWPVIALVAIVVGISSALAARQPVSYYGDALRFNGVPTGALYGWISRKQPAIVGGWGLRLGIVNVISPRTRTIDLPDAAPCETARTKNALLVAVKEIDRDAQINDARIRDARACGTTIYDDGIEVVSSP
jgi:hypothetical protein